MYLDKKCSKFHIEGSKCSKFPHFILDARARLLSLFEAWLQRMQPRTYLAQFLLCHLPTLIICQAWPGGNIKEERQDDCILLQDRKTEVREESFYCCHFEKGGKGR